MPIAPVIKAVENLNRHWIVRGTIPRSSNMSAGPQEGALALLQDDLDPLLPAARRKKRSSSAIPTSSLLEETCPLPKQLQAMSIAKQIDHKHYL